VGIGGQGLCRIPFMCYLIYDKAYTKVRPSRLWDYRWYATSRENPNLYFPYAYCNFAAWITSMWPECPQDRTGILIFSSVKAHWAVKSTATLVAARLAGKFALCQYLTGSVHIYPAVTMVEGDGVQLAGTSLLPPAARMFEKPAPAPHAWLVYATHVMMPEIRGTVEYSESGREYSKFELG
jgi:hypothetical protein